MKRASYRDAINWMAYNDDTTWLDARSRHQIYPRATVHEQKPILSVTASLVADLFDVTPEKLIKDLQRAIFQRDNAKFNTA